MAIYDHEAVRKAYTNAVSIGDDRGVFDIDGKEITIDNSLVESARVELDKLKYKYTRRDLYPDIREFADAMYWNSKGDSSLLTAYYAACEKVKTDNPKPS